MLKIAICDDENFYAKQLHAIVSQYAKLKDFQIKINSFSNGKELLTNCNSFDLIFLDIDMPEMNGLEIGLKIKDINSDIDIIYATNYSDYAYSSFSVRPFGYIVKPFTKEIVFKELSDFILKSEEKKVLNRVNFSDNKITLNLITDCILYFEYVGNKKVKIVTENEIHCLQGSLSYCYEKTNIYGFTYSHKSFVVNMLHIEKIDQFDVIIKNNYKLPIAQKKKLQFMEEYNTFLHKQSRRMDDDK